MLTLNFQFYLVIKEIVILDEVGVFFQVAISLGKENHIGSAVREILACYFNIGIITINFYYCVNSTINIRIFACLSGR